MSDGHTTAQGEDILAYLERAISETEKTARAAAEDTELGWTDGGEPGEAVYGATYVGTIASDPYGFMSEGTRSHIALHDPESVLRRCAADRKLIALHGGLAHSCPDFDEDGDHDDHVRFYNHETCPTLHALAEVYGWAECGWNPIEMAPHCDFDPKCPAHGRAEGER